MPPKKTSTPRKRPRNDSPYVQPPDPTKPPLLAAEYSGHQVVIPRTPGYQQTIDSIKKAFGELADLDNQTIKLYLRLEGIDGPVRIVEELWAEILPALSLINVVPGAPLPKIKTEVSDFVCVRISLESGLYLPLRLERTCTIDQLDAIVRDRIPDSLPKQGYRLFYDGRRPNGDETLHHLQVEDNDSIELWSIQYGGKPVIYLFSPLPLLGVAVQLSLVKAWQFSAIYPPVPIHPPSDDSLGETISWTVDTRSDGTLLDRSTNREVAYLFWEAETNPKPPISPPASPSTPLVSFDPGRPNVHPSNSTLLSFDKVTGYIDDALLAMELHAEARTSFITYWLPKISKHSHIALRFLPQDQYEASAPLQVTPAPEIVTRVFMLFKGVRERDLGAWQTSQIPAEEWSRIVGVDGSKAKDVNLFRVLEWGGMEVC